MKLYKEYLFKILSFLFLEWKMNDKLNYGKMLFAFLFAFVVLIDIHYDSYIVHVKDHQIKMEDYRVVTTDMSDGEQRIFEVKDSYFYFIFDSSDMFNKITNDSYYHIVTAGYRIPIFSIFPKIISMTEIKLQKAE